MRDRPALINAAIAYQVSVKAGMVIAATETEVVFQVSLKWPRPADHAKTER